MHSADLLWHGRAVMIMQIWPLRQSIHSMSQLRLLTPAGECESLFILSLPPIHVSQKLRREMSTVLYNPSDKQVKEAKLSVLSLQQQRTLSFWSLNSVSKKLGYTVWGIWAQKD